MRVNEVKNVAKWTYNMVKWNLWIWLNNILFISFLSLPLIHPYDSFMANSSPLSRYRWSRPKRLFSLQRMIEKGQRIARHVVYELATVEHHHGRVLMRSDMLKKATKFLEDQREKNLVAKIVRRWHRQSRTTILHQPRHQQQQEQHCCAAMWWRDAVVWGGGWSRCSGAQWEGWSWAVETTVLGWVEENRKWGRERENGGEHNIPYFVHRVQHASYFVRCIAECARIYINALAVPL